MIVTETTEKYGEEGDSKIIVELLCDNGDETSVSFGEGEPEDMYLFRDLSDAYNLVHLVTLAYEAGKRGEDFKLIEVVEDDNDF